MTQVYGNYGAQPVYGAQQPAGAGPVTYSPGMPTPYRNDQFQNTQQNNGGLLGGLTANNKPYVTKQTVITAAALGIGGFLCFGPIGGIIGAIVGLLIGIFSNMSKMKSEEKMAQQQPNGGMPTQQMYSQNQPMSANQQYYQQRMQQQQQQQQQQGGQQQPFNPYQQYQQR